MPSADVRAPMRTGFYAGILGMSSLLLDQAWKQEIMSSKNHLHLTFGPEGALPSFVI